LLIIGCFRFENWQKKTRIAMPRTGEQELPMSQPLQGRAFGHKVYRHNKVTPGDPNSKSFKRKQAALERKERLGTPSKKSSSSTSTPSAAFKVKSGGISKKGGKQAKNELKNADQIRKERFLKAKRREKTGRHKPRK
jgi:ATP-dependent RNA helicase DDX54/DBP10